MIMICFTSIDYRMPWKVSDSSINVVKSKYYCTRDSRIQETEENKKFSLYFIFCHIHFGVSAPVRTSHAADPADILSL